MLSFIQIIKRITSTLIVQGVPLITTFIMDKLKGILTRKVNTQQKYEAPTEEASEKPSKTIPDMALKLDELLKRHTRGQDVPIHRAHFESDLNLDFDIPDLSKLDATEQIDYLQELKDSIGAHKALMVANSKDRMKKANILEKEAKQRLKKAEDDKAQIIKPKED